MPRVSLSCDHRSQSASRSSFIGFKGPGSEIGKNISGRYYVLLLLTNFTKSRPLKWDFLHFLQKKVVILLEKVNQQYCRANLSWFPTLKLWFYVRWGITRSIELKAKKRLKLQPYLVINLDGTYSDNENETKRLRSNSGLNSRNADSLSNQNRSSGKRWSLDRWW